MTATAAYDPAPLITSCTADGENPRPVVHPKWHTELRQLLHLSLPCILTTASQQAMVLTDQVFVGHLGVSELAAAAVGNTYFNFLWFFLLGTSTALDTLGSHAYGANNYNSLLVWTFTSVGVLNVLCLPLAVGLWYSRYPALWFFDQEPDVLDKVELFCRWLIPGLWPMIWSVIIIKFMQTQNCMRPPAIVAVISCAINVGLNYGCIRWLGFLGAPIATSMARVVGFSMHFLVLSHLQRRGRPLLAWLSSGMRLVISCCWKAANRGVVLTFLTLGLPGGVMLAVETGAFDFTTLLASHLGQYPLGAHAAMLCVTAFTYVSVPFALGTATAIRVGNLVGAGLPRHAAMSTAVSIGMGTAFQAVCGAVMWLLRKRLGLRFSHDEAVINLTAKIALYGALYQLFDGTFGTAAGALRGLGRQTQIIFVNVSGFWGVGVLLGWYLAFKQDMGLQGLWVALSLADSCCAVLCVVLLALVDWPKEVSRAALRLAVMSSESLPDPTECAVPWPEVDPGEAEGDGAAMTFLVAPAPAKSVSRSSSFSSGGHSFHSIGRAADSHIQRKRSAEVHYHGARYRM